LTFLDWIKTGLGTNLKSRAQNLEEKKRKGREHDHCSKSQFSNLKAAIFLKCDRDSSQQGASFGGPSLSRSQAELFILHIQAVHPKARTLLLIFFVLLKMSNETTNLHVVQFFNAHLLDHLYFLHLSY
jgi:hypothetical protein